VNWIQSTNAKEIGTLYLINDAPQTWQFGFPDSAANFIGFGLGFLDDFSCCVSVINKIMINYYNLFIDNLFDIINNNNSLIIYILGVTIIAIIGFTFLSSKAFTEGLKAATRIGTLLAAGATMAAPGNGQDDRDDRKKKEEEERLESERRDREEQERTKQEEAEAEAEEAQKIEEENEKKNKK